MDQRRGRPNQVRNNAPAPIQITAEQILREAMERVEAEPKAPKSKISDPEELAHYRMDSRKSFEDNLRRQRNNIGVWIKYAAWESSQKEFDRARSVYERALEIDYRNTTLWLKYAEMEMKNRFVNSARNVWDRAVTLLPRVDQLWYKYAHMEEMLGNVANARQIFERWMQWNPDYNAWNSYVKLEMRHNNFPRAREIFERWLIAHNEARTYLKYAKEEERRGRADLARIVYERAIKELGEEANSEELLLTFAQFEERQKEFDRARVIYKYALDHIPRQKVQDLYNTYTAFEKQFGDKDGVEEVILSKRRFQYEEEVKENPHNYDVWFDYARLEESKKDVEKIRNVYERAIANVPPLSEKRFWRRYIYLWINYAIFEELDAKDYDRTREVYKACLSLIPHDTFTFGKIWIMAAEFEIRRKNVDGSRKVLGTAIGKCPKEKLFRGYIDLELQLGNVDRVRKLYEKYLDFMPENCIAWSKFAELETSLNEVERARALYELAISQPVLDMPELLWKAYIDFEIGQKEFGNTRELYKRLLARTKHVKVWISRAQFEAANDVPASARAVFVEADEHFKEQAENKEERALLLQAWLDFERNLGTPESLKVVEKKMPKRIKKKRLIKTPEGEEVWEEYFDYIFPDEEKQQSTLAILENARKWKKMRATTGDGDADTAPSDS